MKAWLFVRATPYHSKTSISSFGSEVPLLLFRMEFLLMIQNAGHAPVPESGIFALISK
jgi:hypothetical protein